MNDFDDESQWQPLTKQMLRKKKTEEGRIISDKELQFQERLKQMDELNSKEIQKHPPKD